LAQNRVDTFLLESAESNGVWSRYSFIGVNSEATLTEKSGSVFWRGVMPAGAPTGVDPLEALRISTAHLRSPKFPDLPPLTGGLVGYLGYEIVRRLEKIKSSTVDDLKIPEITMLLTSDIAVFDHLENEITLIANAINWDGSADRVDDAYQNALNRIDVMSKNLTTLPSVSFSQIPDRMIPEYKRGTTDQEFIERGD
jgi:anthranilate synthase component 1